MSSTVTFGKRERLKFIAAGTLKQWQPAQVPAVYAVTYKQDAEARPKAHTVVYFGETADLSKQAASIHSEIRHWWDEHGGAHEGDLFIFFHPMPGSSQYERANIQHQLVLEYDPRGND
jgi:hypothetical protein